MDNPVAHVLIIYRPEFIRSEKCSAAGETKQTSQPARPDGSPQ